MLQAISQHRHCVRSESTAWCGAQEDPNSTSTASAAFDAPAVGQQDERTGIDRNARLEEQGEDTEQDDVADGMAENVMGASAWRHWRGRRTICPMLRKRPGARTVALPSEAHEFRDCSNLAPSLGKNRFIELQGASGPLPKRIPVNRGPVA